MDNCINDNNNNLSFTVAYATDDVTYIWRHENPVEMPKDMRLSQFDLLETPFNYSSTSYLKGGKTKFRLIVPTLQTSFHYSSTSFLKGG